MELIVAIAIVLICMTGITVLFINTWKYNSYTIEMGTSAMAVSQGVSKIANYIRGAMQGDDGAYAIVSADKNKFVVFSDFDKDGVTERINIYYSNGKIMMGVTDPTGTIPKTYPAGDGTTQTIASSIVNTGSDPIFYYYNRDYPGDTENNPVATPVADVSDIRLIKINLKINIDPNRAPDNIESQTFVELRNLNDYDKVH